MSFSSETAWDSQAQLYRGWRADNQYRKRTGKFVIPLALSSTAIAAGANPVAIVTAFAPYDERMMEWEARKAGSPPVIPTPDDAGAFTFLDGSIDFAGPSANQNGDSFDWRVGGTYLYVQTCRVSNEDGYVLTGFPFPLALQYDNAQAAGGAPVAGPISTAGIGTLGGYTLAQGIDPRNPYWGFTCPTYFPPQLQNSDLALGGLPPP